jgi:hypothetical protein
MDVHWVALKAETWVWKMAALSAVDLAVVLVVVTADSLVVV